MAYDRLNSEVSAWAKLTRQKLVRQVSALTLKDKIALRKRVFSKEKDADYRVLQESIGTNNRKGYGQVNRINFKFQRKGIFFERGAGRGRALSTNPRPWLAPILDPAIDHLADIIANNYADLAAQEIRFLIPGILDKRLKVNNNG